jgi:hypothetical protein
MLPFGSGVGSFDDPKLLFERRHAEKNLRPTLEESRRLQEASAVAEAGLEDLSLQGKRGQHPVEDPVHM